MAEENQGPAPENKERGTMGQEAELRAELERARSGNKILKTAAIVLSALFLLTAGAAFYIYSKVAQTKAALEEAFQSAPPPFPSYVPENRELPSAGPSVFGSTAIPVSSLGLVSGSIPGSPSPFSAAEGEKVYAAFGRYADRPVVKEFIADLKKNPDMARAFEQSKGNNPLAVIASIKNAKGMDKIVAKYAIRPDFLKLMMEVMKDPAIEPLVKGVPGGLPLPGAGIPPPPRNEPRPQSVDGSPQEADDAPLTLDASVVSGTPAPRSAPARTKKAPPPVDSE